MQKNKLTRLIMLSVTGVAGLAISSNAAFANALPITDSGLLTLANLTGSLVAVTSVPTCINWGGGSTCVANTTHNMSVSGSSNLFAVGNGNTIKDLPSFPPPTVTDFETVQGAGA